MIILDTDALSHIQKRNPVGVLINSRLAVSLDQDVWITSVNAFEMLKGALTLIERQKKNRGDLIAAFFLFGNLVNFLGGWQGRILPYDSVSDQIYKSFPARLRQELKEDARIASVALSNNAGLWTCNVTDFLRVPDLTVFDARTGSKVSSS